MLLLELCIYCHCMNKLMFLVLCAQNEYHLTYFPVIIKKTCSVFRHLIVIYCVFSLIMEQLLMDVSQEADLCIQKRGLPLWRLRTLKMRQGKRKAFTTLPIIEVRRCWQNYSSVYISVISVIFSYESDQIVWEFIITCLLFFLIL